jgi:outer membrane protein assembly factor BamB
MTGDGGEPTRRACLRAALSVGVAAGLAGCPTLGADDSEASSDTPAETPSNPVTATETPTATPSPTPTPTPTREPLVRLSGEFAAYRGDAHRRASVPDRTGPSDDPGIAYSRELPSPAVQPVGSGSQLLLAGRDWLAAFDPKRGVREWNLSLDAVVGKPPVVADGTAVLATDTGLIAVEADSTVAWRGTPTGVAAFAPIRVGDRFCVVGDRGLALYTDTGRERWSVPLGKRALATPAATAETVYVPVPRGTDESAVFALTASKGATDWRTTVDAQAGIPPVHADGHLYVSQKFDGITALDAETGDEQWSTDTPVDHPLAVTEDHVLAATDNDITAVTSDGGDRSWSKGVDGRLVTGPVTDAEALYVGTETTDGGGALRALALADGSERWTIELDAPATAAPVVFDGGVVVTTGGDERGRLVTITA